MHKPPAKATGADGSLERVRLFKLMAAAEEAEDAGRLDEVEAMAREGIARAIAADEADWVVDFYAMLARRFACADDWPAVLREIEPALAWLRQAQDPVACIRLAGMLAMAYAFFRQIDRALGLFAKVWALYDLGSGEASFLLRLKLGELHLNLGRPGEAETLLREALHLLDTCSAEQRTPHRRTLARLLLASALLLRTTVEHEADSAPRAQSTDTVMQFLAEAENSVAQVPVLAASLYVAKGYCLSLRGRSDPMLKGRLIGLSGEELATFLPPTLPCLFDWVAVEAAAGDGQFGRAVLDKTDPQREKLPWPHLKPLWYRTQGEVLAAEGDLRGAVRAMRRSLIEDRCNRDREISMVLAMAERVAHADESEARERAAQARAESLALSNASLAAERQRWSECAHTDKLTGLRNRLGLEHYLADAQSAGQACDWMVVMADIDHFKSINDQHSHAVGDKVLAAVAKILGAAVRQQDVAARWGGDEFVLVLRHRLGPERLDAIRRAVETFDWSRLLPEREVTISLGVAAMAESSDFANALALADHRLYAAKNAGRNCVIGDWAQH